GPIQWPYRDSGTFCRYFREWAATIRTRLFGRSGGAMSVWLLIWEHLLASRAVAFAIIFRGSTTCSHTIPLHLQATSRPPCPRPTPERPSQTTQELASFFRSARQSLRPIKTRFNRLNSPARRVHSTLSSL